MKTPPAFFDLEPKRDTNCVGISTFTLCGEEDADDVHDFYEVVIRTRGPGMLRIAYERLQRDLGALLSATTRLEPVPCPICQGTPIVTQRAEEGVPTPMWYVECLSTNPARPHRLCVSATGRDMGVNQWNRLVIGGPSAEVRPPANDRLIRAVRRSMADDERSRARKV